MTSTLHFMVFVAVIFTSSGSPLPQQSSTQSVQYFNVPLDPSDRIHMYWMVDYEDETATLEIRARIDDNSWIGIGFSDYGDIERADFCVLWVDKKGDPHFQDVWTDDAGFITVDDHDDCRLLSLRRKGKVTRFAFTRKFDTCDPQDYVIEEGTTHVIYATGRGPLRRLDGLKLSNKGYGFQRVQLLKNLSPAPELKDDVKTIKIINDRVSVPGVETTYWCSLHRLPDEFLEKHHIVQYEASIQKGNEPVVHHMEVFHCEVPVDQELPSWNANCYDPLKPKILETCKRVLAAWAMGALPLSYPEEAGLPIGGKNFSLYVMLEVHYNNPELRSDWVDSSGIALHYTHRLRSYDAGILELGLEYTNKMAIPPRQSSFELTGYCVSECTRAGLPPFGITVFASQLHTHLTGTRVWTKHVRGGYELTELNRDNHYSTHFQEIRVLKQRVQILPGDALLTTCRYNTEERKNTTLGGFAISEEMCVNYMHYFPKTDLEVCKSSIDSQVLDSFFSYAHDYMDEGTSREFGVGDNYNAIHWSQINADFLKQLYDTAPLSMQCNQSSGDRFPGYWNGMPLTEIFYPLLPPSRKCYESSRYGSISSD